MAARDIHGVEAPWEDFRVVGKSHRKIDGVSKATGEAVYADDIQLQGMLHAKTLRSPHCLLYTSPSPRDRTRSRMPSSA